jgi:protease I
MRLDRLNVAVIATDGFEESELTEPVRALKDAGAHVEVISLKTGEIQGLKHMEKSILVKVDKTLGEIQPDAYDAVVLPGGALNADRMRIEPKLHQLLRTLDKSGKPIAAICHAPWELISAGLTRGRKLTAYHTIQDDIRNAGGIFQDQEVLVDNNLVTSRQPSDLPAFNREMMQLIEHAPVAR